MFLREIAKKTLESLIETVISAGTRVPPHDSYSVSLASSSINQSFPSSMQYLYFAAIYGLNFYSLIQEQKMYFKMSPVSRRKLLNDLNTGPLGRYLTQFLGLPIKFSHFSRSLYQQALAIPGAFDDGYRPIQAPCRPIRNHFCSSTMDRTNHYECDVVIVGSGAGGAPVAAYLAEAGYAVAIVEEGEFYTRRDFTGNPLDRKSAFWRDKGFHMSFGIPPISIPTGKMVGGTTAINSGTCVRPPPDVLRSWQDHLSFPKDFNQDHFIQYVMLVEKELNVTPVTIPAHIGPVKAVIEEGAKGLGLNYGPLSRNAPECDAHAECVVGCPTDAKRSTNVSYLPRAMKAGAHLFTGFRVDKLIRQNSRVCGIIAKVRDKGDIRNHLTIKAKKIILSCGTLQTPLLLWHNKIDLPWMGRNLSCHPAMGMFAVMNQNTHPWTVIPQSYGFFDNNEPRIRFENFYVPPQMAAGILSDFGSELTYWMDHFNQIIQFGFFIKDSNHGSIKASYKGSPIIYYTMPPEELALIQKGASLVARVLIEGGAIQINTTIANQPPVTTTRAACALANVRIHPFDLRLMGFHPLGTCRMGSDPWKSVVDFDYKVHGFDNLFISDGSIVPTSLGVNPQITIMAFAERLARIIDAELSSGRQ